MDPFGITETHLHGAIVGILRKSKEWVNIQSLSESKNLQKLLRRLGHPLLEFLKFESSTFKLMEKNENIFVALASMEKKLGEKEKKPVIRSSADPDKLRSGSRVPNSIVYEEREDFLHPKLSDVLELIHQKEDFGSSKINNDFNIVDFPMYSFSDEKINFNSSLLNYFTRKYEAELSSEDLKNSTYIVSDAHNLRNYGLLGTIEGSRSSSELAFLNTGEPFCAVVVGVQGSGKSHTTSCIIENCMLELEPVSKISKPISTLVFHYDSDPTNFCESSTLAIPFLREQFDGVYYPYVKKLTILASPSFYKQRKEFYSGIANCQVIPLLFRWRDLNAHHLRSLMQLEIHENMPLYMGVLLDLLRSYQKKNVLPTFASFKAEIEKLKFSSSQTGPLNQRMRLIESFLYESPENADISEHFLNPLELFQDGSLVIADLTDPMLSPGEANGIFQVLLSIFRTIQSPKLVVLDEAHKYLANSMSDGLTVSVLEVIRQMRHYGMRIVISSQNPKGLPEEILELCSVAILHRFHSIDWFNYLKRKLPLADSDLEEIFSVPPGSALVFSSRWERNLSQSSNDCAIKRVKIRRRFTVDAGISRSI